MSDLREKAREAFIHAGMSLPLENEDGAIISSDGNEIARFDYTELADYFVAIANEADALLDERDALAARVEALEAALKGIASMGGNLSDDALMEPTGPNDAAARGIMYVGAREAARQALKGKADD